MQFTIAQTKTIHGFSAMKNGVSKRFKSIYHDIFNNLFMLREVEVTMIEKGSHVVYTYKRNNPRKA